MAIDGVAPRAKMNQQRGRRFKSAREAREKLEEEMRIREDLREQGFRVREGKSLHEVSALADSNIITPGTEFMAKLSVALQYYIHLRINNEPGWKNLIVVLSDANVPGEGEHKIMDYIRQQRGRTGWNPNLTHVVSGLDADLIHLALATHEPKFYILREVVFGQKQSAVTEEGGKPKVPYQYLKISMLREYLAMEFYGVDLPFQFDKERIYDDFVFLCFFVGNDFLPHSPTLEIREGGIDLLMQIYKQQLPYLGGWLCQGSKVNLQRVEVIIREVAKCEEKILMKRMKIIKNQESKRKQSGKRPLRIETTIATNPLLTLAKTHHQENPKGTPKKQKIIQGGIPKGLPILETNPSGEIIAQDGGSNINVEEIWNSLLSSPVEPQSSIVEDTSIEELIKSQLKEATSQKTDQFDSMVQHGESIGFGTIGWKDRYYKMKFPEATEQERRRLVTDMAEKFVQGLLWVMAYYYDGVASWTWYYPYHYAPFASDLRNLSMIQPKFELGEPFLPINQLMAVLPAASRFCLPECLQHLFVDENSPILDFYPSDFKCDMNGKRFSWQAVVLLPFIDENRLVETTKLYLDQFTEEEKERNKTKLNQFYVGELHPLAQIIVGKAKENEALSDDEILDSRLELDPLWSGGVHGYLYIKKDACPKSLSSPFDLGEDITRNGVCLASFVNPVHKLHQCCLMEGAREEIVGLMRNDIPPEAQPWHEHPGNNHEPPQYWQRQQQQQQFSIDKRAAHRFIEHGINAPRFKQESVYRPHTIGSTLSASAPEFVPEYVTRRALQITGQSMGTRYSAPMPPQEPPRNVTDAAIRLSERAQRNHQARERMDYSRRQDSQRIRPLPSQNVAFSQRPPFSFYSRDSLFDNRGGGGGGDSARGQQRRENRNSGQRRQPYQNRSSKR
eukprot:g1229.t1